MPSGVRLHVGSFILYQADSSPTRGFPVGSGAERKATRKNLSVVADMA